MDAIVSFIRKYKLLHLVFWSLKYIYLIHQMTVNLRLSLLIASLDAATFIFFQVVAVYVVVGYFLKKFFHKKRYVLFFMATLAVLLTTSFLAIWVNELYYQLFFDPDYQSYYLIAVLGNLIDTFIIVAIFIIVYLSDYYYRKNQTHKKRLREHMKAELEFLKSQLSPHTVFNTLNSIYVLMDEDVDLARETLLKFSSLLKYQLYDCGAKETLLNRELGFISDYMALEKIRYGEKVDIRFGKGEIPTDTKLAPLLLIPFVENAFKHLYIKPGGNGLVRVKAEYAEDKFTFAVENTFEPSKIGGAGGMGLKNVKRRLDLTYPKAHSLNVEKANGRYSVTLTLETSSHEIIKKTKR